MMAETDTRCDWKLICCDIEDAADWSWGKILSARSQEPVSSQTEYAGSHRQAASQPAP
jgi:hypothetical protein